VPETGAHAEQGDALFQGSTVSPQQSEDHDMVVEFITCQLPVSEPSSELAAYHVSFRR